MNTVILRKSLAKLGVKEIFIILSLSIVFPFLLHLVPSYGGVPQGAKYLAMFYAPFLAVYFFKFHVAFIAALFAPLLNSFFTGYPSQEKIIILIFELLVFSTITYFIHRKWKNFWGIAVVSYTVTILISQVFFSTVNCSISFFTNCLPGLIMLNLINIILAKIA